LDEISKDKTFEEIQYEIFNPCSDLLNGVKIFDFECISYGSPLVDLAFFLYTSVNNQDLRNNENEFIRFYYSCISFYGIYDYSIDDCFEDYFQARDLQFLRIMSIPGRNYLRTGQINDETKNIFLNIKYFMEQQSTLFR
jgi:hypothetical protein